MASTKIDRQEVVRLDDYRRASTSRPMTDRAKYQEFLNDLSALADHILGAAEILSRIKPPKQSSRGE